MSFINETTVLTGDAVVIWDGLSQPEPMKGENGKPDTLKYSVKVAIPPTAPEYGELYQISQTAIAAKYPNGNLPRGFQQAFSGANEQGKIPELPDWVAFNASTFGKFPDVYDTTGRQLDATEVSRLMYAGAKVRIIVSPRMYDNKGNIGAGFWLSGVQITDTNAPRLSVAAGMSTAQTAAAFGIAAPTVPPAAAAFGHAGAIAPPPTPAAPVVAPPPVPAAPAPAVAPPPTVVAPNYGVLAPPAAAPAVAAPPPPPAAPAAPPPAARQMTAAAQGVSYEAYVSQGWTDAQLIQNGLLVPLA